MLSDRVEMILKRVVTALYPDLPAGTEEKHEPVSRPRDFLLGSACGTLTPVARGRGKLSLLTGE